MRVAEPEVVTSPGDTDRLRLRARVDYESVPGGEDYWFEVPETLAADVSDSGNPWLLALLPLSVTLGEPLRVDSPVDSALLESAEDLQRIWTSWYPELERPPVEAPVRDRPRREADGRAGAFYSGGVDSSFTAVRDRSGTARVPGREVRELITVGGFDIPLANTSALERLRERSARSARELGKLSVWVRTNLRETELKRANWGRLAHGCALGAVGLVLEERYDVLLIAATGGYRDLHPWGSHPLTDPLMSSADTRFVHDGAAHTRTEKTRELVGHPVILDSLQVCFESRTDRNCGRCSKCLRTMLRLELLGHLDRSPTFPAEQVDLGRLDRMRNLRPWDYRELRDLEELADDTGRRDVADAIRRSVRRAERRERWKGARKRLEETWHSLIASVVRAARSLLPGSRPSSATSE